MRFFFPDSQDQVDPTFDFVTESRSRFRLRHRDDLYAHELFKKAPFDGVLVSKAVLEAGRYSLAQKHRMLRTGVREFFRITDPRLLTMGDCGAFAYAREEEPPFTVAQVIDYYKTMGFDFGMSVDHIIFGYDASGKSVEEGWCSRQKLTLRLAGEFLKEHAKVRAKFIPIGVAQGWSPASYSEAVASLQKMGYDYIALGGMIGLKTSDIVACLQQIQTVLRSSTKMHILGVSRIDSYEEFAALGVTSIDSTSPLRQAFKDMKDNYYTEGQPYTAIRVPQVDANPQLVRRIKAGKVNQWEARRLEQTCLRLLNQFDSGSADLETVLESLSLYESLFHEGKTFIPVYREVLTDAPWRRCPCDVCRSLGIHVMLFRGAERNRRRGFHNLYVFYKKLQRKRSAQAAVFEATGQEATLSR